MTIVWTLLLTVCSADTCVKQEVEFFRTEKECVQMQMVYDQMPKDGDWDSIDYRCKVIGGVEI
jgi:hypothetical protein